MTIKDYHLFNHVSPGMSEMEQEMMEHIPPGGNWKDLPDIFKSKRLDRIRREGGRTTYYGRLELHKPAYTITTYFNRLPNSSNLHPNQNRMISIREAARIQSFPDNYEFVASQTSQFKQIGNAVPPLLGRFIASQLKPQLDNYTILDLFAGAGGLSLGFTQEGFRAITANEKISSYFATYRHNHPQMDSQGNAICGDITDPEIKRRLIEKCSNEKVGVIVGGPPCQGFSYAGWRDVGDPRNQLFRDYFDIVCKIRPEVFVMENVPGLVTMQKGKVVSEILSSFRSIGYHTLEPILLKAEEFGVPQRRRRVVIIGSLKKQLSFNQHPLFSSSEPNLPNPITTYQAISSLPSLNIGDGVAKMKIDYRPISAYDLLMAGQIDFPEFYARCCEF